MKTIWKYPLARTGYQVLEVPANARPLAVAMQHGEVTLWAQVDDSPAISRSVHIVGTGHEVPEDAPPYVGTVIDGPFVWHIYAFGEA